MEALVKLKDEGKIRHIGLSEVSAQTLRRVAKIHHIAAVQLEYSPFELEAEKDDDRFGVIKAAKELSTAVVAYAPLGPGLLNGQCKSADDFEEGDFRKMLDRYNQENFPKALKLVDEIAAVGKAHNATPGQTTLVWLLAQGDHIIPVSGTKHVRYLEENTSALSVNLSAGDVKRIRDAIDATDALGNQYPVFSVQELYGDFPLV